MNTSTDLESMPVGVGGLGLMGCSICTCLLMAGHKIIAVAPVSSDLEYAEKRIRSHLEKSEEQGLINHAPALYLQHLTITENYGLLQECKLVIECTIENMDIKKSVYDKIEAVISNDVIVTSNTSAIPISILQKLTRIPGRFFGLHWAEPSHTTRFLEIICGELSETGKAEFLYGLSHQWQRTYTS